MGLILILILFGLLLLGAIGAFWGYRAYWSPLARLAEAIGKYRDGEFGARIPLARGRALTPIELSFNEMARKIDSMVSELRRLDEMKTDFVSTVSHELRTPLTSIAGYTKLLAQGDAGPINETQKEFLEIVDVNVQRLSELINDLLDIEKIEAGKIHLSRERVDLAPILRECLDTFNLLASQKGLRLKLSAPERGLVVIGDRTRLVQVFMNLISNAVKYTDRGEVEILAEERNFGIHVRVRDTGIGISEEERERLFEKFYRTRSAALSRQGGTGLGLAIVRALVEAHHGKVQMESQVGQGSVFTVALPVAGMVAASAHEAGGRDLTNEPGSGDRERSLLPVWIVDSSEADAGGMALWLGADPVIGASYMLEVRRFRSVNEVVLAVEHGGTNLRPPGAVVVEAGMDAVALSEVSRVLREKLRIVAPLLAVGKSLDAAQAFSKGAGASLSKPLEERAFLTALHKLLEERRRRILIVDPDVDLRILIKRSLEQRGFRVDDLDRGQDVLRRLGQEPYDLLLVDFGLPDVSAADLLRALRRDSALHSLPVFVMLGQERTPPSPEQLLELGADQFVGKHGGIGGIVDAVYDFLEVSE